MIRQMKAASDNAIGVKMHAKRPTLPMIADVYFCSEGLQKACLVSERVPRVERGTRSRSEGDWR